MLPPERNHIICTIRRGSVRSEGRAVRSEEELYDPKEGRRTRACHVCAPPGARQRRPRASGRPQSRAMPSRASLAAATRPASPRRASRCSAMRLLMFLADDLGGKRAGTATGAHFPAFGTGDASNLMLILKRLLRAAAQQGGAGCRIELAPVKGLRRSLQKAHEE